MSQWEFVYCVTKRLSQSEKNFDIILYCLNKSIELASKHHTIKVLTDKETYDYIKNLNVKVEIFDFGHLRFLDDIKISVLPYLKKNEILIDPDVFINKEMIVNSNCDLFVERKESVKDKWYVDDYKHSKEHMFSKHIKLKSIDGSVCNIGILKIFNKNLLNMYINKYNFVKKLALEENDYLEEFPKYSVLLGQLLLQNIVDDNQYKISYARLNKNNSYLHLAGAQKYNPFYLKNILEQKEQTTLI